MAESIVSMLRELSVAVEGPILTASSAIQTCRGGDRRGSERSEREEGGRRGRRERWEGGKGEEEEEEEEEEEGGRKDKY